MTAKTPYRAAGTFAGPAYVEREADSLLFSAICENLRYPYIVAPRQSGKSSLLLHVRKSLDPDFYRNAFVDLSTFDTGNYEEFWNSFLDEIAFTADLDHNAIFPRRPENTFVSWITSISQRLIVFVDEIDALLGAPFREQFFSKLRSLFNKRAEQPVLERLLVVLAGAAHPTQLISDNMRSPFNVGIEISLDDLTPVRARKLVSHLGHYGAKSAEGVAARLHAVTAGSVYLGQFLLERLWNVGEQRGAILVSDVDAAVEAIVRGAANEIHFRNIYQLIASNLRLIDALQELYEGRSIDETTAQDLRLVGISDGVIPFRNLIYWRVFGEDGPLDLVRLMEEPQPSPTVVELRASGSPSSVSASEERAELHSVNELSADEDLHAQFLAGMRHAGNVLVGRYNDMICRYFYARTLGQLNAIDVEDLVQETFIFTLYETNVRVSFRIWLFGVARRVLRRAVENELRKRRFFRDITLSSIKDHEMDLDENLSQELLIRLMTSSMSRLGDEGQILIKLRYWDDMSLWEIAEKLKLPVRSVARRLVQVRRELSTRAFNAPSSDGNFDIAEWSRKIDEMIES